MESRLTRNNKAMNRLPERQKGASTIGTIITIVLLGYGAYIGIQYVPQAIESKSIDSILDNVKRSQQTDPVTSKQDAQAKVIKMLQVNEMSNMTKSFTVERLDNRITIRFSYDRELNLGYKIQPIHYEKSVNLN